MKITVKQLRQLIREQVELAMHEEKNAPDRRRLNPVTGKPFPDRMSDDEIDLHLKVQAAQERRREEDPDYCDGHGEHQFRGRPGEKWCQICGKPSPDNIK